MRLATLGNDVVLCDASEEMLTLARKAIQDADLSNRITTLHCAVQNLTVDAVGRFDLVVCHAVLEWLADPASALRQLALLLAVHGSVSLMFYNRKATLLKRILRGEISSEPSRNIVTVHLHVAGDTEPSHWMKRSSVTC